MSDTFRDLPTYEEVNEMSARYYPSTSISDEQIMLAFRDAFISGAMTIVRMQKGKAQS